MELEYREEKEREVFRRLLSTIDIEEQPFVQAFINNISFPQSIKELKYLVYEQGSYNVENILAGDGACWTVSRNCKIGDIVLWFHAKTAISRITALITQVKTIPEEIEPDKDLLLEWLERARGLYKKYGGKIFAVGRVVGAPEYRDFPDSEDFHFHGRIYADIGDIVVLDEPIDISEFHSFITVSRHGAITPLPAKEFDRLRDIIKRNPKLPNYYLKCRIGDFKLSRINSRNYMEMTREYRRRFLYEIDFRSYYVDYLLRELAGRKYYRECPCHSANAPVCFADNVFCFEGKHIVLEVKLNIALESDLKRQLKKYIEADYLYLDKEKTKKVCGYERKYMYVVDTEAFYRYEMETDQLCELIQLDDVYTAEDIRKRLKEDM